MSDLFLFCDESGNTGTNYLDPAQPFYASAGWCIPGEQVETCRTFVARYISGDQKELKGAALMGTPSGKRRATEILQGLIERGALPFFVAIEKLYDLSASFVNEFFDRDMQGRVQFKYNIDQETMKAAAHEIAKLPDSVIQIIYQALRDPSEVNYRDAVRAVSTGLRDRGSHVLADDLEKSIPLSHSESQPGEDTGVPGRGMSPNVHGFMGLLANVEKYARSSGALQVQVIHDETHTFELAFEEYFGRVADPASYEPLRLLFEAHRFPRFDLIRSVRFVRSSSEPLIQAADVLGAAVMHVTKTAAAARKPRPSDYGLIETIVNVTRYQDEDHVPFTLWVMSERFYKNLGVFIQAAHAHGPTPTT